MLFYGGLRTVPGLAMVLLIEAPVNNIFVSAASILEIAIKRRNGKLDAPDGLGELSKMRVLLHCQLALIMVNLPEIYQPFIKIPLIDY